MISSIFIALGGNEAGTWGSPLETFSVAVNSLAEAGVAVVAASRIYSTAPLGRSRQGRYLNAVIQVRTSESPASLLRILKRIERQAGRRTNAHWGPRPLDLDILDFKGHVRGWPTARRQAGQIVLPHPEMHRRDFALIPLLDLAPQWWHPALGTNARQLLRRCRAPRGNVRYLLDFPVAA
jgi:2-amino-4-hydroxy-6-hydroxymethyldihydropteridine diphosphokinase